jgi:hypothetical protein
MGSAGNGDARGPCAYGPAASGAGASLIEWFYLQRQGQTLAQLAKTIIENCMLNGESIRLDGAIRMQPK